MSDQTDWRGLLTKARDNDPDAGRVLCTRLGKVVRAVLVPRLAGTTHGADSVTDIVQSTLIRIWDGGNWQLGTIGNVPAFATRVALNRLKDRVRAANTKKSLRVRATHDELALEAVAAKGP